MGDVGEFLTRRMRDFIADPDFDRDTERERFEFVFGEIDRALGPEAFKRYNPSRDKFLGKFSISSLKRLQAGLPATNMRGAHWLLKIGQQGCGKLQSLSGKMKSLVSVRAEDNPRTDASRSW